MEVRARAKTLTVQVDVGELQSYLSILWGLLIQTRLFRLLEVDLKTAILEFSFIKMVVFWERSVKYCDIVISLISCIRSKIFRVFLVSCICHNTMLFPLLVVSYNKMLWLL